MCVCKIYLTQVGVMHEAGYVYSIWSTLYHFPFGCLHLYIVITLEILLIHMYFDLMKNSYL